MSLGALARRLFHAKGTVDTSVLYLTMFDSITPSVLPTGGSYAYAGYVDGLWPTYAEVKSRFPGHDVLSIAVFASGNAQALDIENGGATIAEAPGWVEKQIALGVYRPALYIEASNMKALEQAMAANHIARASYRLWVAHYIGAHVCGPHSCGYGLSQADGTQWTKSAMGLNLDRSMLLPDFFAERPAPNPTPSPAGPTWEEAMMNVLPTLQQGDHDLPHAVAYVRRAQVLTALVGKLNGLYGAETLAADGVFSESTTVAVAAVQKFFGLKEDGVCGPATWSALVTGHP